MRPHIDRSLTSEQEDAFFAGRPMPPRPPGRGLFWGLLAWASITAGFITAYLYAPF